MGNSEKKEIDWSGINKIVVGLGNPGEEYAGTRHNIGWAALDAFLAEIGVRKNFEPDKKARVQTVVFSGVTVLLVRPTTYMNLSGTAVANILQKTGLDISDVLVVHDEMDLEVGRLKMRVGGGASGHKGVGNIAELCGEGFIRIKIGIGRPDDITGSDIDWVLSRPDTSEKEIFSSVLPLAAFGILAWIDCGTDQAMLVFNTKVREMFAALAEQPEEDLPFPINPDGTGGSDG